MKTITTLFMVIAMHWKSSFNMYAQKALRMLIFPERNTREYFQQVRMIERSQDINQTIGMK